MATCKVLFDALSFRHLLDRRMTPLKRTALLMTGPLSNYVLARFASGLFGGIVIPLLLVAQFQSNTPPAAASLTILMVVQFAGCLMGELLERFLFFAAVATPRMPGAIRT